MSKHLKSFRLDEDLLAELRDYCARTGTTATSVVNEAIREYILRRSPKFEIARSVIEAVIDGSPRVRRTVDRLGEALHVGVERITKARARRIE